MVATKMNNNKLTPFEKKLLYDLLEKMRASEIERGLKMNTDVVDYTTKLLLILQGKFYPKK
jgi:hypothetical protein